MLYCRESYANIRKTGSSLNAGRSSRARWPWASMPSAVTWVSYQPSLLYGTARKLIYVKAHYGMYTVEKRWRADLPHWQEIREGFPAQPHQFSPVCRLCVWLMATPLPPSFTSPYGAQAALKCLSRSLDLLLPQNQYKCLRKNQTSSVRPTAINEAKSWGLPINLAVSGNVGNRRQSRREKTMSKEVRIPNPDRFYHFLFIITSFFTMEKPVSESPLEMPY